MLTLMLSYYTLPDWRWDAVLQTTWRRQKVRWTAHCINTTLCSALVSNRISLKYLTAVSAAYASATASEAIQ
jgi:hypothetical protein